MALSELTKESLKDSGLDNKSILRSKNMFALGLICWLFNRPMEQAIHFLENKFKRKPGVLEANVKVLTDGYNYGNNAHLSVSRFVIDKSHDVQSGRYTSIAGNTSAAYGLIAAAEKAGLQLFLGSYPITPASDIMHELAKRKDVGVKVMQSEDEIAGISTAIGASFAGCLAATSTSGPGLALKSEAIGLACMAELPLVVIDVMRSGPSTGMPTKTEQTDLLQALYGRNGEVPCGGGSGHHSGQLLPLRLHGQQDSVGTHDTRHPAFRCIHRQRHFAVEAATAGRNARNPPLTTCKTACKDAR